jgi:VWFA-related protein
MRIFVAILLGGLFVGQHPETIRVGVRLVQMSVVARNNAGEQLTDLTQDDFEILDNGKPQAIRFFALETRSAPAVVPVPLPEHVFSNRTENKVATAPGVTIVLFDLLNTHFTDQVYAKQQLIRVLQQIQPGQRIGVYVLGREVTVLHDFTDNPAQLAAVLRRFEGREPHELTGAERNQEESAADLSAVNGRFAEAEKLLNGAKNVEQDYFNVDRATITFKAFEGIANHVAPAPGRKSLVWISGSFPFTLGVTEKDFESMVTDSPNRVRGSFQVLFDLAMRAVNNADLAIYPVDARGLVLPTGYDASNSAGSLRDIRQNTQAPEPPNLDTMRNLANKSGGRAFFNTNDLEGAISTALDDGRVTYTLGFYPTSAPDSKFHTLNVRVRRGGVSLHYRQGYLALAASTGDADSKAELKEALASPVDAAAIGITVKVEHPQSTGDDWGLITNIDSHDLAMERQGEKWLGHLQIVYSVQAETGKELGGILDNINLDLKPEIWSDIVAKGLVLRKRFNPPRGASKVRIAVYDVSTGRIGSISIPLNLAN